MLRVGIPEISLAQQAVRDLHGRTMESDEAIAAFLTNESCHLIVAVTGDGEVVGSLNGYSLLQPDRLQPQFLLYEIDVKYSFRRQGIGSRLIRAFAAEARERGAFEVWVLTNQANSAAMAMYRKCGFDRKNPDDVMLNVKL